MTNEPVGKTDQLPQSIFTRLGLADDATAEEIALSAARYADRARCSTCPYAVECGEGIASLGCEGIWIYYALTAFAARAAEQARREEWAVGCANCSHRIKDGARLFRADEWEPYFTADTCSKRCSMEYDTCPLVKGAK